jgi:hypothetical protein
MARQNQPTCSTCACVEVDKKSKTLPYWGDEIPGAIAMNFVILSDLTNTIIRAKYELDRLRSVQLAGPWKTPFLISNAHHPYNNVLHYRAGM